MSLGYHGERINRLRRYVHIQKNVEPMLLLVPRCKGLRIARFVETSNAESPTMMYISNMPEHFPVTYSYGKCSGHNVYAPHRASPLLCS